MREVGESAGGNNGEGPRHGLSAYLLILLLVPLASLLLAFPAAHTHRFLQYSRRPLWHATDYRFAGEMRNCDVVIFGDSTGMLGVDSRLIEDRTGWKTCNFAMPYMVTSVFGTSLLNRYLARNKAPRFIVFHFSGIHLRPPRLDEQNGMVDAWLAADEHLPIRQRMWLYLRHPRSSLFFAVELWHEFLSTSPLLRPDWSGSAYANDLAEQRSQNGWLAQASSARAEVCGWQPLSVSLDRNYMNEMIARYTRNGTQVVVWVNPSRVCDKHIQQYHASERALGISQSEVYPIDDFTDPYHLNILGAIRNSERLSNFLLQSNSIALASRSGAPYRSFGRRESTRSAVRLDR